MLPAQEDPIAESAMRLAESAITDASAELSAAQQESPRACTRTLEAPIDESTLIDALGEYLQAPTVRATHTHIHTCTHTYTRAHTHTQDSKLPTSESSAAQQEECVGGVSPRACTATGTAASPQEPPLAEKTAMPLAESAITDAPAAQQECVGGVSPRACTATGASPQDPVLPAQEAPLAKTSAMPFAESAITDASAAQQECVGGVSSRACTATRTPLEAPLDETALIDALGEYLQAPTVRAATHVHTCTHTWTHTCTHTHTHTHTGLQDARSRVIGHAAGVCGVPTCAHQAGAFAVGGGGC